jgi:septal ring factor EnvC (AmiA/AmiB activator)
VLVCVVSACVIGCVVGYYTADRIRAAEIAQLTQERDDSLVRERELQRQLEDAIAARAALAAEAHRLQENLSQRLKRLEEIANQLASEEKQRQEGRGE